MIELSDAIDIVTPTSTHYELGIKTIDAGLPLFIEKPLCATYEQGARLVERAEKSGVPIQVGHIERFNRAFRALGTIKLRPQFIEAHRLAPYVGRGVDVAVIFDLMIHDLDLVLALAPGDDVIAVHANGVGVVSDSMDIATARIEFASGLVANVTASRISLKRMRKIRVFGEKEYVSLDFNEGVCEYVGVTNDIKAIPQGADPIGKMGVGDQEQYLHRRLLSADEGDAMKLELESFRDAVTNGTDPVVTGMDGLKALKLAERIIASIEGRM